jgi:hypothetical protein
VWPSDGPARVALRRARDALGARRCLLRPHLGRSVPERGGGGARPGFPRTASPPSSWDFNVRRGLARHHGATREGGLVATVWRGTTTTSESTVRRRVDYLFLLPAPRSRGESSRAGSSRTDSAGSTTERPCGRPTTPPCWRPSRSSRRHPRARRITTGGTRATAASARGRTRRDPTGSEVAGGRVPTWSSVRIAQSLFSRRAPPGQEVL